MSVASDEHFLRAWAERADETAFRSLVGRYAGFVYGAALRRVGDAGLAEEITQDVFSRLSQNAARLSGHRALSGWLHRSTMLIALDRLRHRRRYDARVEHFLQMNTQSSDPLAEALPHLDEALDQLATRDREVLVLHFFDRLTFPEIATRLGGTADAARMRTNRALSALSASLRKKGVTLSVTALSAGLGSTFAQAAPASLAIIPAALGAGKVSALSVIIHALQTMKTAKAAAVALLALVLATPLIFQQQQIAAAEGRIAALTRTRNVQADTVKTGESSVAGNVLRTAKASAPRLDLKRLAEHALKSPPFGALAIRPEIAKLDTNNLVGLIETVLQGGLLPGARDKLAVILLDELEGRDVGLHVKASFAALSPNAVFVQDSGLDQEICWRMEDSLIQWILEDRAEAEAWMAVNREEWNRRRCVRMELQEAAAYFASDPERAFKLMENLKTSDCYTVLRLSNGIFPPDQHLPMARWATSLSDVEKRRALITEALRMRWRADGESEGKFMESSEETLLGLGLDDDDLVQVATRIADNRNNSKGLRKQSFPWIEKILPPNRAAYAKGMLIGRLGLSIDEHAMLAEEAGKENGDEAVAGFIEHLDPNGGAHIVGQPSHSEIGFQVALRVKDPARRLELLSAAWAIFQAMSQEKAASVLESANLSAAEIREIRERAATRTPKKP